MTTHDTIRQFIAENRDIARIQAQRWEGVDPSRLIQALDYLEGMIEGAPTVSTAATTFDEGLERLAQSATEAATLLTDIAELRDQIEDNLIPTTWSKKRLADAARHVTPISMELTGLIPRETVEALWGMVQTGKVRVIP